MSYCQFTADSGDMAKKFQRLRSGFDRSEETPIRPSGTVWFQLGNSPAFWVRLIPLWNSLNFWKSPIRLIFS